jgi:hypothetical protein
MCQVRLSLGFGQSQYKKMLKCSKHGSTYVVIRVGIFWTPYLRKSSLVFLLHFLCISLLPMCVSDLDIPAAAAVEPAANGDAGTAAAADGSTPAVPAAAVANGDAAAASDAEAKAAADAAERASFFKVREGEVPLAYAQRVFERLYCSDINEVLVMEVSHPAFVHIGVCYGEVVTCTTSAAAVFDRFHGSDSAS